MRQEKETPVLPPPKLVATTTPSDENKIINETLTASFTASVDLTPSAPAYSSLDHSQGTSTRSDSGSPELG